MNVKKYKTSLLLPNAREEMLGVIPVRNLNRYGAVAVLLLPTIAVDQNK
jgi:hypothetical protein